MFDGQFLVEHIFDLSPYYVSALILTITLAVLGQIIGVVIGAFICAARLSKKRMLRGVAAFYIWFFRGVPELVLMVLLFSGVAAAGIFRFEDFSFGGISVSASFQAALVAIGVREGAYMGEVIRSGIESVRKAQLNAARALGMTPLKVLWHISAPQALRVIIPPFGNQFNVTLKITSLASVIGVPELFQTTQSFASANFQIFELFIGLAINYLLLTTAWSAIQSIIEARLNRYNAEPGSDSVFTTLRGHLLGRS